MRIKKIWKVIFSELTQMVNLVLILWKPNLSKSVRYFQSLYHITFQEKKCLSFAKAEFTSKLHALNLFSDLNSSFRSWKIFTGKVGNNSIVTIASKLVYKVFTGFSVAGLASNKYCFNKYLQPFSCKYNTIALIK